MDVNTILDTARSYSYTNTAQVSNTAALPRLNLAYQEVIGDIVDINALYLTDTIFLNTVVQQNSYSLTTPTSSVDNDTVRKILSVSIKYKNPDYEDFQANQEYSQGEKILRNGLVYVAKQDFTAGANFNASDRTQIYEWYTPARSINYGEYDIDALNNGASYPNQVRYNNWFGDKSAPFYVFQNNELLIYPYPDEAVVEWIKIKSTRFAKDLVVWGAESTIEVPRPYHEVLVRGLAYRIFQSQWKLNEANDALSKYNEYRQQMKSKMKSRSPHRQSIIMPSLSHLE